MRPGVPWGETNGEVDDRRGVVGGQAEPVADPVGVAGDLQRVDGHLGVRVVGGVRHALLPLDEEGQLRVGLQALDPELAPAQLDTVGAVPVAEDGLAAEPRLLLGDVVDLDDPAEPAAAGLGARADDLAEGGLVAGRVVEHLDDLDVPLVRERKDDVARPEARVDSPVDRLDADPLRETPRRGLEAVALCRIDDVVNSHAVHGRIRRGVLRTRAGCPPDRDESVTGRGHTRPWRLRTSAGGPPRRRRRPPPWRR